MDDKDQDTHKTAPVDIPNLKKEKLAEKKKGGIPIPGGGIARSAATNFAKVVGREGVGELARQGLKQGVDAAARGFLPKLLSTLAGKVAVVGMALVMGGGAMSIIGNSGRAASPQKAANLGAINSTIALPKSFDNTALNYAAKAGKAEQSPAPTAPSDAAKDDAAAAGGEEGAKDDGLKKVDGADVAKADPRGGPQMMGGGPLEGGDGNAAIGDQMERGMGALSTGLSGGSSGAQSSFNAKGLKNGKMEQFTAGQKGAAGKGGKLSASKIRQSAAHKVYLGNGRNFASRGMGRLGAMGTLFGKSSNGSGENALSVIAEGFEGTEAKGEAPPTPLDTTGVNANADGKINPAEYTYWSCTKAADDYGIYVDDGWGTGGCKYETTFDATAWTNNINDIRDGLEKIMWKGIVGLACAIIAMIAMAATGATATSCSGCFAWWVIVGAALIGIASMASALMTDLTEIKELAKTVKKTPGAGSIGEDVLKMCDTIMWTGVASLVGAAVGCLAGPAAGGWAAAISTGVAGAGSGIVAREAWETQEKIKDDGEEFLTGVNNTITNNTNDPNG